MRLRTIKGVESQFFLISDIGEGALVLPLEPAFYWISTNNGDDNQLFVDVLEQVGGDFWAALERVVAMAPYGAAAFHAQRLAQASLNGTQASQVANVVSNLMDESNV